jgi:trimeric autotransporter adhesin
LTLFLPPHSVSLASKNKTKKTGKKTKTGTLEHANKLTKQANALNNSLNPFGGSIGYAPGTTGGGPPSPRAAARIAAAAASAAAAATNGYGNGNGNSDNRGNSARNIDHLLATNSASCGTDAAAPGSTGALLMAASAAIAAANNAKNSAAAAAARAASPTPLLRPRSPANGHGNTCNSSSPPPPTPPPLPSASLAAAAGARAFVRQSQRAAVAAMLAAQTAPGGGTNGDADFAAKLTATLLGASGTLLGGASTTTTPAADSLPHVSQSLKPFNAEVEAEHQKARAQQAARWERCEHRLARLEKLVQEGARQRQDELRAAKAKLEDSLAAATERADAQAQDLATALRTATDDLRRAASDALRSAVADLQRSLQAERQQRDADVDFIATTVTQRCVDLGGHLEAEHAARCDAEAKLARQVAGDLMLLEERLASEAAGRASELKALRVETHEALSSRAAADERFRAVALEEMARLSADLGAERDELKAVGEALAAERLERVAEDHAIVEAVRDYTAALQRGIRTTVGGGCGGGGEGGVEGGSGGGGGVDGA